MNVQHRSCNNYLYSVSQKIPLRFSDIFPKRFRIFSPNFTHLLHVPIYARLQIFMQLAATLTKLCHIKRDHPVHTMCSKCPPSAETHAFRRLWKSLIALLIVVCGQSSQICCSALFACDSIIIGKAKMPKNHFFSLLSEFCRCGSKLKSMHTILVA